MKRALAAWHEKEMRYITQAIERRTRETLVMQKLRNPTPGETVESKLHAATVNNDAETISSLLPQQPPAILLSKMLHVAAREGTAKSFEALVKAGADINYRDGGKNTPVHIAARFNQSEVLKTARHLGADFNTSNIHGKNPLETAQRFCSPEAHQLILDASSQGQKFLAAFNWSTQSRQIQETSRTGWLQPHVQQTPQAAPAKDLPSAGFRRS